MKNIFKKHKNRFCVKYLSEKPKYFVSNISIDVLYQSALKYLNELKSKELCSTTKC